MFIRTLSGSVIVALALAAAGPAHAVTYDCSKAGNANKTACKGKAPAAKPAMAPAKMAPSKMAPTAAHMAPAKPAAAPAGRMVSHTLKNGKTVQYNCDKKGNANKKACKH